MKHIRKSAGISPDTTFVIVTDQNTYDEYSSTDYMLYTEYQSEQEVKDWILNNLNQKIGYRVIKVTPMKVKTDISIGLE